VLRRVLKAKGFDVTFVQNFTDVDDKIIDKAARLRISSEELAKMYIDEYYRDFDQLNVLRGDVMPRATENIQEMIAMIEGLMKKGYAYVVRSGVYLDVTKVKDYGKLSRIKVEELKRGARVEPDPYKRNQLDFALWKFYDSPPHWDSPWGKGRPGWHIECSAMIHRYLQEPIDIHGGGEDLLFPHHENEIAQSESLFEKPLARVWMHVGMVKLEGIKMSKSLGNIISVRDFIDRYGPNLLRYFVLSTHYRKQLEYNEQMLEKAAENWRLVELAAAVVKNYPSIGSEEDNKQAEKSLVSFDQHISSDMNTALALSDMVRVSKLVNSAFTRGEFGDGKETALSSTFSIIFSTLGFKKAELVEKEVAQLIREREELREKGRFSEADEIRKRLNGMKIVVIDHKKGTLWYKSEVLG
jgi:cysteinyl-tRNA synthetase